jgi:hypothetical protein
MRTSKGLEHEMKFSLFETVLRDDAALSRERNAHDLRWTVLLRLLDNGGKRIFFGRCLKERFSCFFPVSRDVPISWVL